MHLVRLYRVSELPPVVAVVVGSDGGDSSFGDLTAAGGNGGQAEED